MKMKFDSHCIVCKKPAFAPRGDWNRNTVTLCKSKKCHRKRKSELQKERRRQKELFKAEKNPAKKKDSKRKTKFFGQLV